MRARARFNEWWKQLNAQRFIALVLGPGLLAMGLDAAVEHIAGRREMVLPAQYIPVLFAPLACAGVMAFAGPGLAAAVFRVAMRAVGAVGVGVGLVGTGFHVRGLMRLLEGGPVTLEGLEAALAVAPPLFAPGAFAGIGAVLWLLGNPALVIRLAPTPAEVVPLKPRPVTPLEPNPVRRAA
jgi:hypothetical protein